MKSDPAREHHERMQALAKEWERKLGFQTQKAYLDVSDVYWLAHDFLNALFAAEGHRTEEELGQAIRSFKHDFLSITPDISRRWSGFFDELSAAQYGGKKPDPEHVHVLFVHCRQLIDDTIHASIEPIDTFTHHVQAVRALLQNGEIPKAEEKYRDLMHEYETLTDERKTLHYERFHDLYMALVAARNASRG
jgi:hypothetical protein